MSPETAFVLSYALLVAMKVVVFILGYLTVRLGYQLIDAGAKGSFKFSASLGGMKADLASVSPGLLFVTLGVFLIGYAIYVDKEIEFTPVTKESTNVLSPPKVSIPEIPSFDIQEKQPEVATDEGEGDAK